MLENKKLKYKSQEICGKCNFVYYTSFKLGMCPECGNIAPACDACENCGVECSKCENGSQFKEGEV